MMECYMSLKGVTVNCNPFVWFGLILFLIGLWASISWLVDKFYIGTTEEKGDGEKCAED